MDVKISPQKQMEALQAPFSPADIEWRIQQAGLYQQPKNGSNGWALVLAYVTNRAIMERLDEVFGVFGWKNVFDKAPDGGVLCGISVFYNNEWITKWDGAENTQIEATKGGLSGAMKRAGVQWGIGRYLYNLEATFVNLYSDKDRGTQSYWHKETKTKYYWQLPKLPNWAIPKGDN